MALIRITMADAGLALNYCEPLNNTYRMEVTVKNDPFASIRIPEYRNLMMARFSFIMSLRMMSTLVGWWIYLLTNAPFAIGLIGLSEVIPALSMALYAGHVIDQSEKKWLLLRGVVLYI